MANGPNDPYTQTIDAYYEKANFFRVIHADGVIGGLTPQGNLHFGFYSERVAFPKQAEFDVVQGIPRPERIVESKKGVFREIESDVVMAFGPAVQFYVWLAGQLDSVRRQLSISDTDWERMVHPP